MLCSFKIAEGKGSNIIKGKDEPLNEPQITRRKGDDVPRGE